MNKHLKKISHKRNKQKYEYDTSYSSYQKPLLTAAQITEYVLVMSINPVSCFFLEATLYNSLLTCKEDAWLTELPCYNKARFWMQDVHPLYPSSESVVGPWHGVGKPFVFHGLYTSS